MDIPVTMVWFVLHGYGQRAAEFLEQFRPFMNPATLFVAPEGLSRFYKRHRKGEIGASWMTSAEREAEIEDYVIYLDTVYDYVSQCQGAKPFRAGVLGFSQGSSTASRWVYSGAVTLDRLILWGGPPAAELRTGNFQEKISPCVVDWVTGTEDRFTAPEILHELIPVMDTAANPVRLTVFQGGHELDSDTLAAVLVGPGNQFRK
jgi:predicted esterase